MKQILYIDTAMSDERIMLSRRRCKDCHGYLGDVYNAPNFYQCDCGMWVGNHRPDIHFLVFSRLSDKDKKMVSKKIKDFADYSKEIKNKYCKETK